MYTRCPHCETVYRISAAELRKAHGEAACGSCGRRFSALDELEDDLEALTEAAADHGQSFAGSAASPDSTTRAPAAYASAQPPEPWEALPPVRGPAADLAPEDRSRGETEAGADSDELPFPLILDAPTRRRRSWPWAVAAFVLALALAAQAAWYNLEPITRRLPQVQPWVQWACHQLGCELPVVRDLEAIRLLNRDVREHPRFQQALLVNATLVNSAAFSQPFPVIQLSLYNHQGGLLARRSFQPVEYLDRSVDQSRGMAAGQPVHVVLEIAGAVEEAVGFEFGFL